MADTRVIPRDTAALEARMRTLYPNTLEFDIQVATMNYHEKLIKADKAHPPPRTNNEEIIQQVLDYRRDLERALTEGRLSRWDGQYWTETLLGAGSNRLKSAAASKGKGPLTQAGLEVTLSALKNGLNGYFASEHAVEAARQRRRISRDPAESRDVISSWAASCLDDRLCGQQAPYIFEKLPTKVDDEGRTQIAVFAGEVILGSPPSAFHSKLREAAQPDGSLLIDPSVIREALKDDFRSITEKVEESNKEVREELRIIREGQETVIDWVNAQKAEQRVREEIERDNARRREIVLSVEPVLSEAEGGLAAVSALMLLVDPKLADEIGKVGGAVIEVARTGTQLVQVVSNLANGLAAGIGAGVMAATGNFIGAAVALVGLFLNTGPSETTLILEEVKALREDMRKLQTDMSNRFDRIDQALNHIYANVMAALDMIQFKVDGVSVDVTAALTLLDEQRSTLARIEREVLIFIREGERDQLKSAIDSGLGRTYRSSNPTMTMAEYHEFEGNFYKWATRRCEEPTESYVPDARSDSDLADRLMSRATGDTGPGAAGERTAADNLALVLAVARDRGWPGVAAVPTGRKIPNPDTWAMASAAYAQLESEWPSRSRQSADIDSGQRRAEVRRNGEFLIEVLHRISAEVGDGGSTLLSRACDEVAKTAEALGGELENEAVAWQKERMRAQSVSGQPYFPAWKLPEEVPEYDYGPPVPLRVPWHVAYPYLTLPTQLTKRLPAAFRAWSALQGDYGPFATGSYRYSRHTNSDEMSVSLTLQVHAWPAPEPGDNQPAGEPGPVVARCSVASAHRDKWPVDGERDSSPVLLGDRWNNEWAPRFETAPLQNVNMPVIEQLGRAVAVERLNLVWQEKGGLFTYLSNSLREGKPSLAVAIRQYDGACRLLKTAISLAMPDPRANDDLLRAVLDGLPVTHGGVGFPTVDDIADILTTSDPAWRPRPPELGERPLETLVRRSTETSIEVLRDALGRQRESLAPTKKRHRQPAIETALLRLTLAELIINATASTQWPEQTTSSYTVQPGDTLSSIASKFQVEGGWEALYLLNEAEIGPDPHLLLPGLILRINTTAG